MALASSPQPPISMNASSKGPPAVNAPTTQLPLPEGESLSLQRQWQQAVEQWEIKLVGGGEWKGHPHRLAINKFQSWQDLMEDLRNLSSETKEGLIQRMLRKFDTIPKVFNVFLSAVAMTSQSPEVRLLWGVLYLGVTTVAEKAETTTHILGLIGQLDSLMVQFDLLSKHLIEWSATSEESNCQVARAVVDLFEAIINFWTEAVMALKTKATIPGTKPLPKSLRVQADQLLEKVRHAVERLKSLASALSLGSNLQAQKLAERSFEAQRSSVDRTKFPCHCLPDRRGFFYGREDTLSTLRDKLAVVRSPASREEPRCAALYGMPGVGKTAVALHFAYNCADKQDFAAILWVNAEDEMSSKTSFTEIARKLELVKMNGPQDHDASLLAVKNWLRKTERLWLLIYDNVEDSDKLKPFLPDAAGPILITTRYYPVAIKVPNLKFHQEITRFNESDSLSLLSGLRDQYRQPTDGNLTAQQGTDSTEDLHRLAVLAGGLALGIEHMAACIENDRQSVEQFLHAYNKMASHIHQRDDTGSNAPHTIKTLWELAISKSKSSAGDSYKLLLILSLLAPDNISLDVFSIEDDDLWEEIDDELNDLLCFTESATKTALAVQTLQKFALIQRPAGNTISIHRLLQEAVYLNLDLKDQQNVFRGAVQLLYLAFPRQEGGEHLSDKWKQCGIAIQHVLAIADRFMIQSKTRRTKLKTCPELQKLMTNAAWFLYETGEYQTALDLVEKGWAMCPDPENSLPYAHLCNTAGVLYFEWNDLAKSLKMHQDALRIRSNVLKEEENVFIGWSHFNIGQVHSAAGSLDEARGELEKAKGIFEAIGLLNDRKDRGLFMMVYGRIFFLLGELKKARGIWEDSKTCLEEAFPEGSMLTAYIVFNFGNLELAEKNIDAAREAFDKGLALATDLAPTHALVAAFHFKLGDIQLCEGNYNNALFHCEEGLFVADLRKLKGDRARLLYLKAKCLAGNIGGIGKNDHAISHHTAVAPAVGHPPITAASVQVTQAAMQKLAVSTGVNQDPDHAKVGSGKKTSGKAEEVRKMAEAERDEVLKSMGREGMMIPDGIPEAEVYDRLCCLYNR